MSNENLRSLFQLVVRQYGLLNEQCCDTCCGQDISVTQSHILFEVARQHNPSMRDIAQSLGVDITTFSRQVKSLVDKGYLLKTPDSQDQRVHVLSLTQKGEELEKTIDIEMNESLESILSNLSDEDRQTVTHSIDLLKDAMQQSNSLPNNC